MQQFVISLLQFTRLQSSGPRLKNETICLNCQHHTKDDRCETCLPGYFRRPGMKPEEPCMK
ncbi:hypothetical protein DPMN_070313 [Dreissena polymorpha]|uniref:Laminin/attractin/netrin-like EGF domain-containing protein n=1 Tax=Dreissena polymorpha TaxID=45954 RepID=A0A9D3Z126_DREPO|nr:hypothetical protein DPMN_070313 [Dreissena polymorpha]